MSSKLKLPQLTSLDVVMLHYRPPETVIMQVPLNEERTEFSTYRIQLDRKLDYDYLRLATNGRTLLTELRLGTHLIYWPKKGQFLRLEEKDNGPTIADRLNAARVQAGRKFEQRFRRWPGSRNR